jgi:hypothetical protein
MQYELKISGSQMDDGAIDLDRLAQLAEGLRDIAKGALQIRLLGSSQKKGRETMRLNDALRIRLRGLKPGSTILELECEPFKNTLAHIQGDFFKPDLLTRLPEQTPVALIVETFSDALNETSDSEYLDKPLLHNLHQFKKLFLSDSELFQFTNKGSMPSLKLARADFDRIKMREDRTPDPAPVILSGTVELLQYSKSKIVILTEEGRSLNGFLAEGLAGEGASRWWGKKVTITGTAHFRPSGRMAFVEVEQMFEPRAKDEYFSKPPRHETVEQQLERQLQQKGNVNNLAALIGILADDDQSLEADLMLLSK